MVKAWHYRYTFNQLCGAAQLGMKIWRAFIRLETLGALILLGAALLALIIDNSPWRYYYEFLWHRPISIELFGLRSQHDLSWWINDGLMVVFFLLIGLEIKREIIIGELNSRAKALLPGIAAIGGMVMPALIYLGFNWGDSLALRGFAIPSATDVAFSLGILALLGRRVPLSLKVFLMALAIFDDLGSILIIALFYSGEIHLFWLVLTAFIFLMAFVVNRLHVTMLWPYVLFGILLWVCILPSGIHPTLVGVLLASIIPIHHPKNALVSPLKLLEKRLHPWVIFFILPLFAFANAGISLFGLTIASLAHPITLGIIFGLLIGKSVGIFLATALSVHSGWVALPTKASWRDLFGVSLIGGVGFTMSLFMGTLAFGSMDPSYLLLVRLGVIIGSILAGISGYGLLRCSKRLHFN